MNLRLSAILAAVCLFAACGGSEEPTADETVDAGAALHTLFGEHFERNLELNPLSATFIGDDRYNDRMANSNSPAYMTAAEAMDEEFLQRLLEIDRERDVAVGRTLEALRALDAPRSNESTSDD